MLKIFRTLDSNPSSLMETLLLIHLYIENTEEMATVKCRFSIDCTGRSSHHLSYDPSLAVCRYFIAMLTQYYRVQNWYPFNQVPQAGMCIDVSEECRKPRILSLQNPVLFPLLQKSASKKK